MNTHKHPFSRTVAPFMRLLARGVCLLVALSLSAYNPLPAGGQETGATSDQQKIVPFSWIDADNGYHITRLTNEPNSRALDSRRNAFTPDGNDMIYTSTYGIHVLNLATRHSKILVRGPIQSLAVGTKTRRVFFSRGTNVYLYAVDVDTGAITKVGDLPALGEIMSVNADETLIVGKNVEPGGTQYVEFVQKATQQLIGEHRVNPSVQVNDAEIKERATKMRVAANVPEDLFTVDLSSGQVNTIAKGTDWIAYAQFSPTDPSLMMYALEGMYYETNRIWLMHSDGTQKKLVHERTEKEESATREFWSPDGKTIWYEWQKPRGKNYALVGYNVGTGKRQIYQLQKGEASIAYNVAGGGGVFCGAGHRASSAKEGANRGGKQSIELLYPVRVDAKMQADPEFAALFNFNDEIENTYSDAKYVGLFRRVPLVNLFKNDYDKFEPNVRFTPDNKRVIFTSNLLGPTYIYAVDLTTN